MLRLSTCSNMSFSDETVKNFSRVSCRLLLLDTLRQASTHLHQASAALGVLAFGVIADKHTQIDRDRITENEVAC